ncbi:hypothetical protein HDU97_002263 [Phlyctochytrium planicorne]|nr:hypothetical protein HDU97_002263 [Phlyctochytrium planicorne]
MSEPERVHMAASQTQPQFSPQSQDEQLFSQDLQESQFSPQVYQHQDLTPRIHQDPYASAPGHDLDLESEVGSSVPSVFIPPKRTVSVKGRRKGSNANTPTSPYPDSEVGPLSSRSVFVPPPRTLSRNPTKQHAQENDATSPTSVLSSSNDTVSSPGEQAFIPPVRTLSRVQRKENSSSNGNVNAPHRSNSIHQSFSTGYQYEGAVAIVTLRQSGEFEKDLPPISVPDVYPPSNESEPMFGSIRRKTKAPTSRENIDSSMVRPPNDFYGSQGHESAMYYSGQAHSSWRDNTMPPSSSEVAFQQRMSKSLSSPSISQHGPSHVPLPHRTPTAMTMTSDAGSLKSSRSGRGGNRLASAWTKLKEATNNVGVDSGSGAPSATKESFKDFWSNPGRRE